MNEAEIRADERRKCWDLLQSMIVSGELPGNGCDKMAERNGIILAANALFAVIPRSYWTSHG